MQCLCLFRRSHPPVAAGEPEPPGGGRPRRPGQGKNNETNKILLVGARPRNRLHSQQALRGNSVETQPRDADQNNVSQSRSARATAGVREAMGFVVKEPCGTECATAAPVVALRALGWLCLVCCFPQLRSGRASRTTCPCIAHQPTFNMLPATFRWPLRHERGILHSKCQSNAPRCWQRPHCGGGSCGARHRYSEPFPSAVTPTI